MFYHAKNSSIQIGDTTMDYISFGYGKRNLIMLPGAGDGLKTAKGMALPFAILYREFAKDFKVYVFSRKNKLPEQYSSWEMARDQKFAMDILGIQKADVIGVSQGGTIAQCLAIEYPEIVNRLILAVTFAKPNPTLKTVVNQWLTFAEKKDYRSLMMDTFEKSYSEHYLQKYRKYYPVITRIGKPKSFDRFIAMIKAITEHNCFDKLGQIMCPVLIIGGKQDHIVTAKASDEMASRIKNNELYLYEKFGHAAYEEAPDFNQRIMKFLKS
ncbi:MAG: alpha/beta hydrolase [Oscillospiraceae bacterium]|nr:alpha/beta hydrolase [Oscillospiraceae bacterium]